MTKHDMRPQLRPSQIGLREPSQRYESLLEDARNSPFLILQIFRVYYPAVSGLLYASRVGFIASTSRRVYLSSFARGWKVLRRYEGVHGTRMTGSEGWHLEVERTSSERRSSSSTL